MQYLNSLNDFLDDEEIYFYKEVLIHSPEKRPIHLLTITSHDDCDNDKEKEELF